MLVKIAFGGRFFCGCLKGGRFKTKAKGVAVTKAINYVKNNFIEGYQEESFWPYTYLFAAFMTAILTISYINQDEYWIRLSIKGATFSDIAYVAFITLCEVGTAIFLPYIIFSFYCEFMPVVTNDDKAFYASISYVGGIFTLLEEILRIDWGIGISFL